MAYRILFFLCILSFALANPTTPSSPPKVHEDVKEEPEENIRVARHPKYHQQPQKFDYKAMVQQDPQKIRYAQQQQMDSYIRAYQHEHNLRRVSKSRKQRPSTTAKTAYDTRPKSENMQTHTRQFNSNSFPVAAEYDNNLKKKVVDANIKNGYQVTEDLDSQASLHQAKVYLDQEELLKSTLSANYLAKQPTYVLANPQLNIDPKILAQGLQYTLPENHQLTAAGFQPASKTDIEALSSLLGQTPNAQLQGLNELLGQQANHIPSAPHPQMEVSVAQIPIKEVSVQPEALLGLQEHHAQIIKEQPQISHIHHTPKTHVDINAHSHTQINHEVKIIPSETPKSIYEDHGDNLQYAARYAFGYKIRDYHSGSNFGHEEVREGDVAKGHYHVLLPDGRLQNVEYWADPSGYHAKVTYSNVAQHK